MPFYSLLDLVPIREGHDAAEAFRASRDLARKAEAHGYRRYWLAEHHNMPGIGSAATAVLIGHIAGATSTMRVGSGGVMLPNHSPLVVAEQFGTLASLYPGRIDLGLGRAPGTDPNTVRALRRERIDAAERFPHDVRELQAYFQPAGTGQSVRAVPGAGIDVPIWILGSSTTSAALAASLGLPYAFASHFAPFEMLDALALYRDRFRPSSQLNRPYAMVGVNVVAAGTDTEAQQAFTSKQQQFLTLMRGRAPGPLPPPVENMQRLWSREERARIQAMLQTSAVGSVETVRDQLAAIVTETAADELIVTSQIFDPEAALHSCALLASACQQLPGAA